MIGWKRRGEKKEERQGENRRRNRVTRGGRGSDLRTGWGWQRGDGSMERGRVGRRQAATDSSTTGRGSLNDSLFLHDFNS